MPNNEKTVTVGLVGLGCAKNTVDLQVMAGGLLAAGISLAPDPDSADVILVNTCAFIDAARKEAESEILRACALKRAGKARFVIVSGCLPQRYGAALSAKYPDVDGWLGIDHLFDLAGMIRSLDSRTRGGGRAEVRVSKARNTLFEPPVPDFTVTGGVHAFLKIADGCDHACAYCAIPAIRGRMRSRLPDDIAAEARALVESGIRELDVVGQDITAYGRDLRDGTSLATLLRRLDSIDGDFRLRLLYGYPTYATGELLSVMAGARRICRYIDIPIQHSHPEMLRAMRRADTVPHMDGLVARFREACPGIAVRTTCIVGFPGETEGHFEHLLAYVKASRFDNLGVFCFSPEEGTAAASMDGQVPREVAEDRRRRLMLAQRRIVRERNKALVGKPLRVLVETAADGVAVARSEFQAPDVDGTVIVADPRRRLRPGAFADVEISGFRGYDLTGRLKGRSSP